MNELALFVKPWKTLSLPQLARRVKSLGFDLIELPVRPGFQVEPAEIERALPAAVNLLADEGIRVLNVTADIALDDERLYSACAAAGTKMNRVMFWQGEADYWTAEAAARRQLDAALPFCERYDIQIGIQNHSRRFVPVNEMAPIICSKITIRAISPWSGIRRIIRLKAWIAMPPSISWRLIFAWLT